jgi:hypothetical protein
MNIRLLETAIQSIEDRAQGYAQNAGPEAAYDLRWAAETFAFALDTWMCEPLLPVFAAKESPWDEAAIERKLRTGELRNVGDDRMPKVRRVDLLSGTPPIKIGTP